ncbi:MAG: primosomal protein N' [Anaerolineae bacterium]|nr:primosomal protein N' [Anaerolineae bacterium]MDW8098924.1 primosomal protein N' [Anaerolineae bacterium]
MFAEVAVDVAVGQPGSDPGASIFTYAVPESLCARLQPGHLVWIPFANRRLQGVVIGFTDQPPPAPVRPIEALARPHPVVTSHQLALARWLSQYYLAPLMQCIRLMFPSGVAQRVDTLLELVAAPPFPSDLTPEQHRLIALLQQRPFTLRRLRRRAPELARRSVVAPLLRRGLITKGQAIIESAARPRVVHRVRLIADVATIERVLPTLGHPSRQADVLCWLMSSQDPLPALTDVCIAVGCHVSVIESLVARGWVEITPRRQMLVIPDLATARAALETTLARAPAQAAALAALLKQPQPVDEVAFRRSQGVRPEILRALEARGLIRRHQELPAVILTLSREQAAEAIIALRGLERHRKALDALQKAGGEAWVGYLYAEAGCDRAVLRDLEAAGLVSLETAEAVRDPLQGQVFAPYHPLELSSDQQAAWETLRAGLRQAWSELSSGSQGQSGSSPPIYLIYGVTGSGKTELYLRAIAEALAHHRQAIVLVPEIALTPQAVQRFAGRFPGRVAVWHSALSHGERFDLWRRMRNGGVDVVVGSRSALFVPLPRLGLIVMDEEHEPAYKQERAPRYHAREVALALGRITGAPVILGSATPSLESYWAARQGRVHLIALPRRVLAHQVAVTGRSRRGVVEAIAPQPSETDAGYVSLPQVEIVDLRQELRAGNRSIFSRKLQEALAQTLDQGQQAILFLNRRGTATFVICRDCGLVLRCPRCEVPLIYHEPSVEVTFPSEYGLLVCHHCNRRVSSPRACPRCGGPRIRYFGAGTQRVVEEVKRLFPQARVVRWDRDVAGRGKAHERIWAQFLEHEADVLVGTQMIAKGLDLPLVTLVGVVSADVGLYLPDFRAAERTFQLLSQVAGRAGRSPLGGRVIVQTYTPDHYAIVAASRHDFESFYRQEMRFRREQWYPPFARLARLIYVDSDAARAEANAMQMAQRLWQRIGDREDVRLIGPAPCFFARHRGRYRWQLLISAEDPVEWIRGLPLSLAWRVDVDPVDLL